MWPRSSSVSSSKMVETEVGDGKFVVPAAEGRVGLEPDRSREDPLPAVEEGHSRKKLRLGWGQGLAKYEKEKVEGSEVCPAPSGLPQGGSGTGSDSSREMSANLEDGCAAIITPALPEPGSCDLAPALDDKLLVEADSTECKKDGTISSGLILEDCLLDSSVDIEVLDVSSLNHVNFFLTGLLHAEDTCGGNLSNFRHSVLDKLLVLKGETSKLIEKVEAVIDSYEIELKSLDCIGERNDITETVSALQVDGVPNHRALCVSSCIDENDRSLVSPVASLVTVQPEYCTENHTRDINSNNNIKKATVCSNEYLSLSNGDSISNAKSMMWLSDHVADEAEKEAHACFLAPPPWCRVTTAFVVDGVHTSAASCLLMEGDADFCLSTDIMDSNRESARKATEAFIQIPPSTVISTDTWKCDNDFLPRVKEKLMVCKRYLRFKERALSLKFKAFRHMWREDLRMLDAPSCKNNASKVQKRSEMRCHSSHSSLQKHRSSTRSRMLPLGNLSSLPTDEMLNLSRKLVKSKFKMCRKSLKMPAMVLDERELKHSRFITNNGLVEDPILLENERSVINPWTEDEQKIFMEKLVLFGKDFHKISSFLNHKTTADCVEFYYKKHKLEDFEAVRKCLGARKQSQSLSSSKYLMSSAKKWKSEHDVAPLDVLGAASLIVSQSNDACGIQKYIGGSIVGSQSVQKMSRITVDGHADTAAADVLAGIGSAMSSEGMSSCVTSSVDPAEKVECMPVDCTLFSEVSQMVCEEDNFSDDGYGGLELINWSDDEKSIFMRALRSYGKDFSRISLCLGTRSREQCKIFFSKARKCLGLDMVYEGTLGNGDTPVSDINCARSDYDEACAAEMDSTNLNDGGSDTDEACPAEMICNNQSFSEVDVDRTGPTIKSKSQEAIEFGNVIATKFGEGLDLQETAQENFRFACQMLHFSPNDKDIQSPAAEFWPSDIAYKEPANASHHTCASLIHIGQCGSNDNMNVPGSASLLSEAGALRDNVGLELSKSNHAVLELNAGCCPMDISVSKTDSRLSSELPINTDWNSQENFDVNSNVSPFISSSFSSYCHKRSYGSNFFDTMVGSGFALQPGVNLPHLPRENSQVISCKQKEDPSAMLLVADDNTSLFRGHDQAGCLPPNLEVDKKHIIAQSRDHAVGSQSSVGFDESVHVLRGYPLHLLNQKDDELRSLLLQRPNAASVPMNNGNRHSNQLLMPDMHVDKCRSGPFNLESNCAYVHNSDKAGGVLLRPCFLDTSREAEKKSNHTGDVRIFGQILSHPSPVQKPDNTEYAPLSKENRISKILLPNGRVEGTFDPLNAETSSPLGLAKDFQRSYNRWNGHNIQTGFSSLASSELCFAKCASVVSGFSYYPKKVKAANGRGVVHQGLFPADVKGHLILPELRSRAMIDALSGCEQPARVAVNMAGGVDPLGGALVSDPIAALRLHFLKQIASLGCSEEPPVGNLGSR